MVYLARRDVESPGAQVHFLPLVNEGQHKDDTGALWRTNSPQTKHYYPLIVWHRLQTKSVAVGCFKLSQEVSGHAVGVTD